MPHVLIVEDDDNVRAALRELVSSEGFTVAVATDVRDARIQIVRQAPDAVLSDLRLPDGSGLDVLRGFEGDSRPALMLMTGHASVDTAIEALRLGVADYLIKPINIARLKMFLSRVPRVADLQAEARSVCETLRQEGRFGSMLGRSEPMRALYTAMLRVAPTDATVFLLGESGTGKELAARTLHDLSRRRSQVFLPVNCGAISPQLIESEMFGHERGSFTGAERQHKGFFERADGGTLFLDEIGEMPLELQVKLLRVLETGQFMRIGASKEMAADVRVVAATNRDPEDAVRAGNLREDLYHRLNVFPLCLPPLRVRGDDVRLLAEGFLDGWNRASRTTRTFAPQTLAGLLAHDWPGNVRELKNFVQRAFILADGPELDSAIAPLGAAAGTTDADGYVSITMGTSLADAERQLIQATLKRCNGVRRRAAEVLGISAKTLYNRLEEYTSDGPATAGHALHDDANSALRA